MADYLRPLRFGLSIEPTATALDTLTGLAEAAEAGGLDLIAVQDHPYQPGYLDTWTLIALLAGRTGRIGFYPAVANLPLRPPAMLAKAAASLDLLTGGRVELAVGGGAFTDAIAGMGGPPRTGAELVESTEEALQVIRLLWQDQPATFTGKHYRLLDHRPGPLPAHPIGLWLGAFRNRMLALTGRAADGWVAPLNVYLPPEQVPAAQQRIDDAARAAGRDPAQIRRIYNVVATIGPARADAHGISGTPEQLAETLARWATELGFDTFVFCPTEVSEAQVRRFAEEVVPRTRELVAKIRRPAPLR